MQRYFILFLLLGALSCDKDARENSIPLNASKIVGSWQIISESYSIGGPQIIKTIKDGGIYNFGLDGTFIYEYAKDPALNHSGTFNVEEEALTLHYMRESRNITQKINLVFEGDKVIFIPMDPICIEGCSTTLKRVS